MTREQIFELIVRHVRQVIPTLASHAFTRSDRLRDLGANSVDRAEIVMLVLESLSLSIPRVELFGPGNIGELADLIHTRLEARAV
ncbi:MULTISPECIES: acyl carrier protein [Pseudomonas]|uniref:Acyl carrier protein n=1 Tax=Pseudomonas sessilinigenes TaxID=658629 RepID=A0ABX8MHP9_9PSED|nr:MULTISPECIES: acyl carrier protein [Pseudomonas]AZC18471.1 Polyketide biosynthesis acyl-carrier-protein AcpK [Pseudomonas sp. CMR5c]QXH37830.1 acyl carrier protein [Pseudomonas sessilinigenes]